MRQDIGGRPNSLIPRTLALLGLPKVGEWCDLNGFIATAVLHFFVFWVFHTGVATAEITAEIRTKIWRVAIPPAANRLLGNP